MLSDAMYPNMSLSPPCVFSVVKSGKEKRMFQRPLAQRETSCWGEETIWFHSFGYRWHYPVEVCQVVRPQSWRGLWYYFSCHDLWHHGTWNLWNLLNNLSDLNKAWDRGIRTRLTPTWNWKMYDSEAEFEKAVLKLKLVVQRDSYFAFHNGVFRKKHNRKSWQDGRLWWFDWETNLRDLWAGEPVGDARLGWIQMSTENGRDVVDNGWDAEDLDDDEDDDDKRLAAEEHIHHWPWENAAEAPDDNLDTTTLVETGANLNWEDVRVLAEAFDILSVLSDDDWKVDFDRRRASGDLRGLVRMELERLYHDHYPFGGDNTMSASTHGKTKGVKKSGRRLRQSPRRGRESGTARDDPRFRALLSATRCPGLFPYGPQNKKFHFLKFSLLPSSSAIVLETERTAANPQPQPLSRIFFCPRGRTLLRTPLCVLKIAHPSAKICQSFIQHKPRFGQPSNSLQSSSSYSLTFGGAFDSARKASILTTNFLPPPPFPPRRLSISPKFEARERRTFAKARRRTFEKAKRRTIRLDISKMASNQAGRRQNQAVKYGVSGSQETFLAYPPFTTRAIEPQIHHGFNPNPQLYRVNQGNAGHGGFAGQGGHPGNQHHQGAPNEDAYAHPDCKNRQINVKRFAYRVVNCFCSRCQGRTNTLYVTNFGPELADCQIIKHVRSLFSRYGRVESVNFVHSDDGRRKKPMAIFVRFGASTDAWEARHAFNHVKLPRLADKLSVQFAQGSMFLSDEWKNRHRRKEPKAKKYEPFPWPQPVQNRAFGAGGAAVHHMAHPNIQGMMAPMGRAGGRPMGNKNGGNHSPRHVIARSPSDPFVSTEPTVLPSPDDPNSWLRPIPPINRMGPTQRVMMPPPGQRATMPPPAPLPLGSAMGQQAFAPRFLIPFAPSGSAFYPPPHGLVAPFVPAPFPTTHNHHPGWFFFPPAPVPAAFAPAPAVSAPTAPVAPAPAAPVAVAPPAPPAPVKIPSPVVAISQDVMPDDAMVEEVILESGHRYLFCEGQLISKESPSPSFVPSKPTPDSPTPNRESRRPLVVNGSYGGIHHQLALATSGRMPVTTFRSAKELIPEGTVPKSVIAEGKKNAVFTELIPEGLVPKSVIVEGKEKAVSPPVASSPSPLSPVPASVAASEASLPAFIQFQSPLAPVCAPEVSPPIGAEFPSSLSGSATAHSFSPPGGVFEHAGETVVRRPSRAQFTRLPSEWASTSFSGMPDPSAPSPLGSTLISPLPDGQLYAPGPAAIRDWHCHANAGHSGFDASPAGPPPAASSVEVHQGFYGELEPFPQDPSTHQPSSKADASEVLRKDKKKNKKTTIPTRPPPAASSIEIHRGLYEFLPFSSGLSTGPPSEAGASSAPVHKTKTKKKKGVKNAKKASDGTVLGPIPSQTKVNPAPSLRGTQAHHDPAPPHPDGRKANDKKKKANRADAALGHSPVADAKVTVGLRPTRQRARGAGGGGAQALRDLGGAPGSGRGGGGGHGVSGGGSGSADADTSIHGCFTGLPPSFDPWPRVGSESAGGQ
ncbi:hypothetical protein B0T18DRAFT_388922 [Schizothecium vesticola]|uniref:RRM domain-containing protein n=1 Tax=Schizothecium vesticola TaxID=314040 RepID=A0AA40F177_9PEZI|nr:hypothetical protein B0T18DRAFT_388922 [Schizothecium vesticola]